MASESFKQADVNCPFYHRDDGRNCLTCEGIVEGSTIQWNFGRKKDLQQQMDIFCCAYYKNCEIYRMLMESKY